MATWSGIYTGTVSNVSDPMSALRVKLRVPQVLGAAHSHWAVPASATLSTPPPVGTKVMVMFEGGEPAKPVYFWQFDADASFNFPVSIADGGTGQTTASAALAALGGFPSSTSLGSDLSGTLPNPHVVATHLSSPLPVAQGGTGQATAQAAMNALGGAVTSGDYLRGNGSNIVMSAIQAGDVPTLNQSTTGNAATATALGYVQYFASTGSSGGQYQQVCTVTITSQYNDQHNTFLVQGQGAGAGPSTMAILNFRVKQQAALGSAPYVELYSDINEAVAPANFLAIINYTTSATTVELWFEAPQSYESYWFRNIGYANGGGAVTYPTPAGWIAFASLPTGTQQAGVQGPSVSLAGAAFTGGVTAPSVNVNGGKTGNAFSVGGSSDFGGTVYVENSSQPGTPGTAAAVFAAGGNLKYVSEDGNAYDTGRLTMVATGQVVTATPGSTVAVAGISAYVAAATYHVRGVLFGQQNASVSVAQSFGFSGPGVSSMRIGWNCTEGSTLYGSNQFAAMGTQTIGAVPTSGNFEVWIEGIVTFSAAGTFEMVAAEGTSGDSWTVFADSVLTLEPVN